MRRFAALTVIALALACAKIPKESTISEPRESLLAGAMIIGISVADGTREADAPVQSPEDAWVGFRKLYPEEAKDCDGWAHDGPFFVFSVRPEEKKQEAGFKTVVYVKQGTAKFRLLTPLMIPQ